jgi:hypothetical protein
LIKSALHKRPWKNLLQKWNHFRNSIVAILNVRKEDACHFFITLTFACFVEHSLNICFKIFNYKNTVNVSVKRLSFSLKMNYSTVITIYLKLSELDKNTLIGLTLNSGIPLWWNDHFALAWTNLFGTFFPADLIWKTHLIKNNGFNSNHLSLGQLIYYFVAWL